LALPLISRGQVIGAMTVQSERPTAFSDDDITVLQTMADQLANAIENARLLEQEQTRAQELTVLNEMSRALSAELELAAVLRNVYQYTSRLMDATNLYVALYDAEQDEISFPLYAEGELIRTSTGRKTGQGLTEHVIRTRAPLLISENVPARLQELGIESIGRESQSWLGVPMTIGAQVIGVIAVQSYTTPRVYNERHRDLLYVIANQAAIAVQNARLFGQVQATLKELEDTHRRYLQEAWTDYLQFAPATSYETGRPDAALLGDTVLPEIQQAMAQNSVVIATGNGDHSTLVAPIALRGQVIGTVDIEGDGTRHWTEEEMALVQAVSERIAQIAENLRLFDETQRRAARERLLNEITARIRSSVTMEAILNSTVREISHLTRASSAEIELQVAETDS
jgi:GAF domain-containing protein